MFAQIATIKTITNKARFLKCFLNAITAQSDIRTIILIIIYLSPYFLSRDESVTNVFLCLI